MRLPTSTVRVITLLIFFFPFRPSRNNIRLAFVERAAEKYFAWQKSKINRLEIENEPRKDEFSLESFAVQIYLTSDGPKMEEEYQPCREYGSKKIPSKGGHISHEIKNFHHFSPHPQHFCRISQNKVRGSSCPR